MADRPSMSAGTFIIRHMNYKILGSPRFGDIRVVNNKVGVPLFVARDITAALCYSSRDRSINEVCKHIELVDNPQYKGKVIKAIPVSDVMRLVLKSRSKSAVDFLEWFLEDVVSTNNVIPVRTRSVEKREEKVQHRTGFSDKFCELIESLKSDERQTEIFAFIGNAYEAAMEACDSLLPDQRWDLVTALREYRRLVINIIDCQGYVKANPCGLFKSAV